MKTLLEMYNKKTDYKLFIRTLLQKCDSIDYNLFFIRDRSNGNYILSAGKKLTFHKSTVKYSSSDKKFLNLFESINDRFIFLRVIHQFTPIEAFYLSENRFEFSDNDCKLIDERFNDLLKS